MSSWKDESNVGRATRAKANRLERAVERSLRDNSKDPTHSKSSSTYNIYPNYYF